MAKPFKLQISLLNSIQLCRPKDPSSLVKKPLPLAFTYMSKTYDISLPTFPDPPSSPTKGNVVDSSKITSLGCATRSKSCIMHDMTSDLNDGLSSQACSKARNDDKEKLFDSPFSTNSNEKARTVAPPRIEKKKEKTTTKKPKAKVNDETDSLSSPRSSFNSSHGFNNPSRTSTEEEPLYRSKQRSVRTRRFKRYGSKEWEDGSMAELENESRPEPKPISGRSMVEDRKVNQQSFVVVKRSVDPYEDFKKSMLEMIVEKQMFEPNELEQLLMSFLSLNSRMHHKAILKAFTEIWKEVFSAGLSN